MVHPDQLPAQLARRFRPEWRLVFFSAFGFGLLAHFYKMANWLPNWDSLVFRYDAQQMLQYGRYFLSLACGLSSYYDLPWLNLLLGLLFLAGSAVCVAALLHLKKPVALVLAGAASLLAALLGWAVALCTARAAHKTLVTVAATLGLAVVYALVYQRGMALLEQVLGQVALGENNTALTGAGRFLGGAACGEPLLLLVLAVGIVLLCAALGKALSGPYLTLMTTRRGAVKRTRARLARRSSLRRTLLRRELLHLGSSASYLLNCAMGSLALLLLSGTMGYKADALRALAARLPARELGVVLLTFTVVLVAGMNLLTVPSVSLEGEQLWQLQSLPVTPWQVLRAKLDLHLLVTLPPALLCLACGLVLLRAPWTSALLAGLLVALDVVFMAAAGLMLGVAMPRFHWTSEMAVIKQNPSVLLALLVNWAAGFVLGVGVLVLAQFVSVEAAWMAALGILALADGAALRWLKTKGAKKLQAL